MSASKQVSELSALSGYRPPGRGAVCFTWDDGFASHAAIGAYAAARRQHHTFGIYTSAIGNAANLSSTQILALYNQGHEIASHSVTHAHIKDQTVGNRATEYDTSKSAIEAIIGSGKCTTWIYPYGDSTSRDSTVTDPELYLRYDRIAAVAGPRVSPLGEPTPIIFRQNWTPSTHQQVLEYIRLAAAFPIVFVVYGHDLDGSGTITSTQAYEAIDLANSLGVSCLTLAEAFPRCHSLLDPGFENTTCLWDKTDSPSGQQTAETVADTPSSGMAGSRSLHLQCNSDSGFVYVGSNSVPVTDQGRGWTFSGRYRVNITSVGAGGKVYARIRTKDGQGTNVSFAISSSLTSTSWSQFSVAITPGSTARFVSCEFVVESATAEAWFDHVHVGPTEMGVLG